MKPGLSDLVGTFDRCIRTTAREAPRQFFTLDDAGLKDAPSDVRENVLQIGIRVMPIHPGRLDQTHNRRRSFQPRNHPAN